MRVNENADPGWGPGSWESVDWANRVSARSGVASFRGVESYRRMAWAAGAWVLILVVLGLGFRPVRRRLPA